MTTPEDLLAEADAWSLEDGLVRRLAAALRAEQERVRRLSLALAEEQARSANRAASLEAVREALGDAAGQMGTLAEDVGALVNVVESVRGIADTFGRRAQSALDVRDTYRNASSDWARLQEKASTWRDAATELERALLAGRKEG